MIRMSVLAALAVMAMVSSALADTYRDNVFLSGEPRWGSNSRVYLDRNVQYRRPMVHHRRGAAQYYGEGETIGPRLIRIERYRRIYRVGGDSVAPPVLHQRPVVHVRPVRDHRKLRCNTCNRPTATQNQKIVVKNVGAGANVTVNATATQQVGGGAVATRTGSRAAYGGYVHLQGQPRAVSKTPCFANGRSGFRGVDEHGRSGCVH